MSVVKTGAGHQIYTRASRSRSVTHRYIKNLHHLHAGADGRHPECRPVPTEALVHERLAGMMVRARCNV